MNNIAPTPVIRIVNAAQDFLRLEAAGGILLVIAATFALIVANTPLFEQYDYFLNKVEIGVVLKKTPLHWINDGLMAVFFFLVGLEIKREMVVGELSSRAKALLPIAAAIGGMIVPALIYWAVNRHHPEAMSGWAIPCATDIAFALGVLSLLGARVPLSLKILLTAIAIIDDLGAILIIALFYTADLQVNALLIGLLPLAGLLLLNRCGVMRRLPYIILGLILWVAVLKSGVHATMAGVITALFIPARGKGDASSPAETLEHALHPWVVFLILPLFAFANAGVPFKGMGVETLAQPVPLGIILGLVLGKQIGIFGALALAIKSGLCPKPDGAGWGHLYGLSILCGIGFTMSLFIGGLAFSGADMQAGVRLGVLAGSLISAFAGFLLLRTRAA